MKNMHRNRTSCMPPRGEEVSRMPLQYHWRTKKSIDKTLVVICVNLWFCDFHHYRSQTGWELRLANDDADFKTLPLLPPTRPGTVPTDSLRRIPKQPQKIHTDSLRKLASPFHLQTGGSRIARKFIRSRHESISTRLP